MQYVTIPCQVNVMQRPILLFNFIHYISRTEKNESKYTFLWLGEVAGLIHKTPQSLATLCVVERERSAELAPFSLNNSCNEILFFSTKLCS